ncbi:MAG: hypothetical protein KKE91_02630, partial [Candidatus Omnitrophica bacterium]|nr:hypothetical protein [Candidatus Omnitrophota bacterium]
MKRKIFICGLLFLLLATKSPVIVQGQSQEGQPTQQQDAPGQETGDFVSELEQGVASKLVTAIEVKGNKHISSNTVISKMKIRVGSLYQENIVSDDLRRLYLLGFFSDIKIDTQDYKRGLKIIITVVERPIIDKITFSGIRRLTIKEDKLKESLKSKETQYLDYPNLAEDVKTLKKLYEKIGYSGAKIEYQVDIDKENDKAGIRFKIIEGRRIRIKNIYVEGNMHYPDRRILRLMKTKRAWTFNAGILKEEVLKEDIQRLESFYHREGFADVGVDYEIKSYGQKQL